MQRAGKWLMIAGAVLFVLQVLAGVTLGALMGARILPLAGPHPFLWIAMLIAAWLLAIGAALWVIAEALKCRS